MAKELAAELGVQQGPGSRTSQAVILVDLALKRGLQLFHDERAEPYTGLPLARQEIWPVSSKAVRRWLAGLLWREEGKAASGEVLAAAINVLFSMAVFEGAEHPLHVRVAWYDNALWYDLGDWRAVKITATGWEVIDRPPVLFRHFSHQRPQVEPRHGGSFDLFFQLMSPLRGGGDRVLLGVTTLAYLWPGSPRPILSQAGPQGSGKSTKGKMIKRLVDPSVVLSTRRLADFRELQLQLEQHWLLNIDNISGVTREMSDALSAAVTGDADMRRQLYTDQDTVLLAYRRAVLINGLTHAAERPDLLDRAMLVTHERIPNHLRREEEELWPEFEKALPDILGGAFDILAKAIAIRPMIHLATKPRMADFAALGFAIAEAAGWGGSNFLAAYDRNVAQQHEEAVSSSVVAQAVVTFMERQENWQGPASQLKPALDEVAVKQGIDPKDRRSGWPQDAPRLSKELHGLAETLAAADVQVSFPAQGRKRSVLLRTLAKSTVGTVGTVEQQGRTTDGGGHDTDGKSPHTDGRTERVPSYADATDGADGKKQPSSEDVLEV